MRPKPAKRDLRDNSGAMLNANPDALPALALLHGFLGSAQDWDALIAQVSPQARCRAIDLPGHGAALACLGPDYTMPGAAERVARQCQALERPFLYGYSMGGRLALHMTCQGLLPVRALILESCNAGLVDDAAERAARDDAWADRFDAEPLADVLQDWYRQPVFATLGQGTAFSERVTSRLGGSGAELARSLRGMSVGRQTPLWSALPTLKLPVLLIAGERDTAYVDCMQRMADLCPRAEMRIVLGAGHNVHAEQPAELHAIVSQFLRKHT
ncbi:MAG: 2-succinyl-6-hydroxy-2,4-cyclohexadiene-1-carboxylate synthase [Kiritimatiellae bacterium]|nr:2-succinyl-6-hydroxy-2,4-cyclohexadiene-1-carboxylate synthase [Kiritimatiellia bacterium]